MVGVFREVRRVLKRDGTLWLNLGDSYAAKANGRPAEEVVGDDRTFRDKPFSTVGPVARPGWDAHGGLVGMAAARNRNGIAGFDAGNLKPKDMCGVPWRVAFALQEDGWWLRQDIIWAKPNPMPESVTDRCTKAHEYLFLLAKSERYYYDQGAIAESAIRAGDIPLGSHKHMNGDFGRYAQGLEKHALLPVNLMRNKRSVWEIATAPFLEAHFATFPPALVEPCILAGCPKGGTVLDPFGGAGTVGLVADRLERNAVLIELNPKYNEMATRRIVGDAPLFVELHDR